MRFTTAIAAAAVVGSVSAGTTFDVLVGDGGLKFNPPFVNAVAGDTVNFAFVAKNQ
jgi:plastocyanin